MVQNWVSNPSTDFGVMLADHGASAIAAAYTSLYNGGSSEPAMYVTWVPRTGNPAASPIVDVPVGGGMSLSVNAANGGLELDTPLLHINGANGLDLDLGSRFSSQGQLTSAQGAQFGYSSVVSPGPAQAIYLGVVGTPYGPAYAPIVAGPDGQSQTFFPSAVSGIWFAPGAESYIYTTEINSVWYWSEVDEATGTQTFYTFSWDGNVPSRLAWIETQDQQFIYYSWTTNSSGAAKLASITDSRGRTITPTYTSSGLLSGFTDSAGPGVSFQQNSSNELSQITNTANGTIGLGYNSQGDVNQITDPDGDVTSLSYDSSNRVTQVVRQSGGAAGTLPTYGFSYSNTLDAACDQTFGSAAAPMFEETTYTTPNGNTYRFCDDAQDRVLETINPAGTITTSSYNNDDAPLGSNTYASRTAAPFSGKPTLASSSTTYQSPYGEPTGTPTTGTVGNLSLGTASFTAPSGQSQPLQDGALVPTSTADSQGNSTVYAYDNYGNVTKITDPLSSQNSLKFGYTTGNWPGVLMTASERPDGGVNFYGYDSRGNMNVIARQSPLGQESLTYDGLSRVQQTVDGNGITTNYGYNGLDEVTHISYVAPNNGGTTDVWSNYDSDGNLTSESDPSGTQWLNYNNLGELTSVTLPAGGGTVSYTYDPDGNLTTLTNHNGTYTYHYNNLDQLDWLTEPNGNKTTFAYNQLGQRTQESLPNGDSTAYTYDSAGRELTQTTKNSAGTVLVSETYSYTTSSGAVTSLIQTQTDQAGNTTTYTYDALNRLTDAKTVNSSGGTVSDYGYVYDGDGNLLAESLNGATQDVWGYNAADEQTSTNGATNSFDADGNLTNLFGNYPITYNTRNQTTTLAGVGYSFFGSGQNDLSTFGGDTVTNNQLGLNSIALGGATSYPTYDSSGTPIGENTSSGDYYFITDPHGTVLDTLNSSGQIVRTNTYDPYGTQTTSGSGSDDIGYNQSLTYPGWGVNHYGARLQYQGRWTQPDPADISLIGDPTQADPYQYAGDDPVNNVDVSGRNYFWYIRKRDIAGVQQWLSTGQTATNIPVPNLLIDALQALAGNYLSVLSDELEHCRRIARWGCMVDFSTLKIPLMFTTVDTHIPTGYFTVEAR